MLHHAVAAVLQINMSARLHPGLSGTSQFKLEHRNPLSTPQCASAANVLVCLLTFDE
jgi:hypothetical protein